MRHWGFLLSFMAGIGPLSVEAADAAPEFENDCGMPPALYGRVNGFLRVSETLDYTGTLLVEYGSDREFIAVSSTPSAGTTNFRRLSQRAGAPVQLTVPLPVADRGPCGLAQSYGLVVDAGSGVIAGRATYRLTARPKDTLRLAYVMDLDAEMHMPLRVLAASPDGQVLERYEFAEVSFQQSTPFTKSAGHKGAAAYRLETIPPGFIVVGEGQDPVDFLVLSDGLATVSVFIENQPRSLPSGEGVALRGATLTYTRGTENNRLITVLGEIPIPTARLLADAVRPEGSD